MKSRMTFGRMITRQVCLKVLAIAVIVMASVLISGAAFAGSRAGVREMAGKPKSTGTVASMARHQTGAWKIVQGASEPGCTLADIARVPGRSSLWAVGNCRSSAIIEHLTLAGQWEDVPLAVPTGAATYHLRGVAAVSPSDVWAVGDMTASANPFFRETLIEHWNGAQWAQVPSPSPSFYQGKYGHNILYDVAAASPTSVWAVGEFNPRGERDHPLIEHWDGSTWTHVHSPAGGGPRPRGSELLSVAVAPGTHVAWAFGYFTTRYLEVRTLALHLGTHGWTVGHTPNPYPGANVFRDGIVANTGSSNTVWAVGGRLTERRTQAGWHVVPVPNTGARLTAAASIPGTRQVWAVGSHQNGTPLTERWNGHAWKVIACPTNGEGLTAVAALSPTKAWAVGGTTDGGGTAEPLIMHYR